MNHRAWTMLAAAAILLQPVAALAAFQCPAADPGPTGDKPAIDPGDMTDATISDALKSTVRRMLAEGVKSGSIVDALVVADCRRIDAEPNVTDASKAGQVRRFASTIAAFVYAAPGRDEEDIVVDVPVPTALYNRLRQAADKAEVSQDVWVNEAIAAKLGKP